MKKKRSKSPLGFEKMSSIVTKASGSTTAFIGAVFVIIAWLITGPIFKYSDTWQLVINTGTTIITFLMVFLIQRTQNKDSIALHLKLNELVVAHEHARVAPGKNHDAALGPGRAVVELVKHLGGVAA